MESPAAARPVAPEPRSLANLEAVLRVVRVPRADVVAMLGQVGEEVEARWARTGDPASGGGVPRAPAAGDDAFPAPEDPAAIVEGVRRLYAPSAARPELTSIRDGRVALLEEALANHADGRYASAVALAITQFDGITADVPPTPGAAFPFLVADPRDRERRDPLITAELVADHPGCSSVVAQLMRTGRPDTNTGEGLHRHGIMHGRDLRFGTRAGSEHVLGILSALVAWAEPLARARASAS